MKLCVPGHRLRVRGLLTRVVWPQAKRQKLAAKSAAMVASRQLLPLKHHLRLDTARAVYELALEATVPIFCVGVVATVDVTFLEAPNSAAILTVTDAPPGSSAVKLATFRCGALSHPRSGAALLGRCCCQCRCQPTGQPYSLGTLMDLVDWSGLRRGGQTLGDRPQNTAAHITGPAHVAKCACRVSSCLRRSRCGRAAGATTRCHVSSC